MSEILPYSHANKLANPKFMKGCRRLKTSGSETEDSLSLTAIVLVVRYQHLSCWFPSPKGPCKGGEMISEHAAGCDTGEEL